MIAGTLAWLAGIVLLQLQPALPPVHWLYLSPLVALVAWRAPRWRPAACAAAGFLWALAQAHWMLERALPAELEGADVEVAGQVVGIPERDAERLRFLFAVAELRHRGKAYPAPGKIRLNWYRDFPHLESGERWRLTVRLKRPRGFSNPGGFDYEAWLYREGIRATGYVRRASGNARIDPQAPPPVTIDRLRTAAVEQIATLLDGAIHQGLLSALTVGYRGAISAAQWEVLRRTGTSHLIAISGLHIGLVAGMVFAAVRRLWAVWPGAALRIAAPRAAAGAALAAALGYAALAGFSIPTQRALIMVAVAMGAVMLARALRPGRTLLVALALVLAWDPAAVLSVGFWLSFAAVALILWVVLGTREQRPLWYRWLRVQGAISLGLAPVLAVAFGQLAWTAPLANLLAIPWVGFVVVPSALAGVALLPLDAALAAPLLELAHGALALLWWLLERLAALPGALWPLPEPPLWSVTLGALGAVLLLAPRGVPLRVLGLALLVPMALVAAHPGAPPRGFRLALLDVGQGLAVVVRTAGHTLVYDAGPQYGEHFDAGAAVVVPYLRSAGVARVDRLMISHGDSDHRGGVASVLEALPVTDLKRAPEPGEALGAGHCQAGQRWVWDGVEFSVLHPAEGYADPGAENDHSCVLAIRAGRYRVLLAGDVEEAGEQALLRRDPQALRADLIVVPHHGSATSSSPAFVAAVNPALAWVSAGYANRWGFPKAAVVERYRARGAALWSTARHGALEITVDPQRGLQAPRRWREAARRYWSAASSAFGWEGKSSTIAPLVSRSAD